MKYAILVVLLSIILGLSGKTSGEDSLNKQAWAENYFSMWVKTQQSTASEDDIERYLALLVDDVGHQHLPYDPDATRSEDGKKNLTKGMMYYLGTHTEYAATLNNITLGFNVVVIKYRTVSVGVHPQTGELIEQRYDTIEVLELEGDKVAVIRKYSE
ncbi:MAG: hypothetical protein ACI9SP_002405 [Arenicella sp.]|jgi:hypothetical protein